MDQHKARERHTSLKNQSSEEHLFMSNKMTSEEVLSLMILNSGISVTGTISNFLVILAVLSDRQLRQTGTAVLMVSLSSFDLMLCVVYQPMKIYTINHVPSAMFNTVRRILGYILMLGSLNSTFAISMDRFVSICFPYRYVEWTTGKLTFTMIFLTWFFAAAIAFLNEITEMPSPNYYLLVYITLLIVLIISFHVGMSWVARREAKQIARLYPPECQEFSIWSKSTVAVAMVIVSKLVCWAPIIILLLFFPSYSPFAFQMTLAFASLNSAINPFIFCWRLEEFRKALCLRTRVLRRKAVITPN